jgi:hypothetical protein
LRQRGFTRLHRSTSRPSTDVRVVVARGRAIARRAASSLTSRTIGPSSTRRSCLRGGTPHQLGDRTPFKPRVHRCAGSVDRRAAVASWIVLYLGRRNSATEAEPLDNGRRHERKFVRLDERSYARSP